MHQVAQFAPSDELQPLAVISNQLWRDRFHADPAIAGKSVWIDRQPFTIVGVAPAGFHAMMAPWSTAVWATAARRRYSLSDRNSLSDCNSLSDHQLSLPIATTDGCRWAHISKVALRHARLPLP